MTSQYQSLNEMCSNAGQRLKKISLRKKTKMDSILDFSFCHTVFIELTVSVLPSMIETQRQYIDLQY